MVILRKYGKVYNSTSDGYKHKIMRVNYTSSGIELKVVPGKYYKTYANIRSFGI